MIKNDYNLQLKKQKIEESFLNPPNKNSELDFSFLKDFSFPLFEDFNLIEPDYKKIREQKRENIIRETTHFYDNEDNKDFNKTNLFFTNRRKRYRPKNQPRNKI